ncbi:tRNA-guanine transglycosylase [Natranaeroarchaeum sulfidigenes]|uniref:Queuine/archaeosine tRNA-ribosyltransferase n=1 Tax=Natranaeroarchaeum sulfidigenes TaxID=2784880 RepID=A0A897MRZ6_9EURY|nr:tRNA-guanine transglycosylase [Natranaeroarchaeum sulfidigenes]QSG02808.1 Queuine/archaeosine tRNA-ribosyltransferase [Natranaeroarchaeum sulfidigenes]
MSRTITENTFNFEVNATAGDARTGTLHVNGTRLKTPNLFPVMNFYAGGTENSVYGGGVHRTMKEFMIGAERVSVDPLTNYFDATMMSVSSLTDYNLTRKRFEAYLDTPIKERELFEPFEGTVFADSGGFKFLNNAEIDGSDFEEDMDQRTVYQIQKQLGSDIIVNLDHPIAPDDSHQERVKKAERTAENIHTFLSLTRDFDGAQYLTLHGYNYSMMNEYLDVITDSVPQGVLHEGFDGIALGSLVPKKDDRGALIQAVTDCREVMAEWGMEDWPLHVLGISSRAIPILAALGADSFDSSTHIHNAINGKYSHSLMDHSPIKEADFSKCDCPVCQSDHLVNWMRGNTEYKKDILGPVAMHNLIVQKRELADIRNRIQQGGEDALVDYFEETFGRDRTMRQFAHQVVNQSLGGYF